MTTQEIINIIQSIIDSAELCDHHMDKLKSIVTALTPQPNPPRYECKDDGCELYHCKVCGAHMPFFSTASPGREPICTSCSGEW